MSFRGLSEAREICEVQRLPNYPNNVVSSPSSETNNQSHLDVVSDSSSENDNSSLRSCVSTAASFKSQGTLYYTGMNESYLGSDKAPKQPYDAQPQTHESVVSRHFDYDNMSNLTEGTNPYLAQNEDATFVSQNVLRSPKIISDGKQISGFVSNVNDHISKNTSPSQPSYSSLATLIENGCDQSTFSWAYGLRPSSNAAVSRAHRPTVPRKSKAKLSQGPRQLVADWQSRVGPRPIHDSTSNKLPCHPVRYESRYFTSDGITLDTNVVEESDESSVRNMEPAITTAGTVAVSWNGSHYVRSFSPRARVNVRSTVDEGMNTDICNKVREAIGSPGKVSKATVAALTARVKANVTSMHISQRCHQKQNDHTHEILPRPDRQNTSSNMIKAANIQAISTGGRGHLGSRDFCISPRYADAKEIDDVSNGRVPLPVTSSSSPFGSIAHIDGDLSQINFVKELCLQRNSPLPSPANTFESQEGAEVKLIMQESDTSLSLGQTYRSVEAPISCSFKPLSS